MAIAVPQSVNPEYLLQAANWAPQGWRPVNVGVLRQLAAADVVRTQLDAFEWVDVKLAGASGLSGAVYRMRDEIQKRGSTLYAYALLQRTVFNVVILGIPVARATAYRLVLLHSAIQLIGWAVVILVSAFAAIIFLQYITLGRAPAVADLQNFWSGLITSAGQAGKDVTSGFSTPFIWVALAAGTASILFYQASKEAAGPGARIPAPRAPGASVGVKAGPITARTGT
jgi:hypothetical protein